MPKTHELKCWPEFFEQMVAGTRGFDVRLDDRGFEVGDTLYLQEWRPKFTQPPASYVYDGEYTGRTLFARIGYRFRASDDPFGMVSKGCVVLGIDRQSWWENVEAPVGG